MVLEDIAVRFKFIIDKGAITKLSKSLQTSRVELQKMEAAANVLNKEMPAGFKTSAKELGALSARAKQFKFEFLGIMFFGMAMQRVFGGLLRAGFATFNTVTEGTEKAGGAVTQLNAAWEFFKFSLIDVLTSSALFKTFVDWIIKIVDWWSDLSPITQGIVAGIIVLGAAIGTILFAVGTLVLGFQSLSLAVGGWAGALAIASSIVTGIGAAFTAMKAAGAWLFGGSALATTLGWVAALAAVVVVAFALKKKFGSWGDAFKAWAAAFALAVAGAFDFVLRGVETVIDFIIAAIANLTNLLSKLAAAVGLKGVSRILDKITMQASNLVTQFQTPDLLQKTAVFLDNAGFNPQPVADADAKPVLIDNPEAIGQEIARSLQTTENIINNSSRSGYGYFQ